MISLQALLFMALFTVALAHRYEWFHTRVSNTLSTPMIRIVKKNLIFLFMSQIFKFGQWKRANVVTITWRRCVPQPWSSYTSVLNTRSVRNMAHSLQILLHPMTLTFFVSPKHMFVPLIQIAFYNLLLLLIIYFLKGLVPQVSVAVLVFSLDPPTALIKWNLLSISHLRTWWCVLGFTAVQCCLPVSTALQDHVPGTFRKNLCPLLVSCHPSTPHIIFVVTSTFMLMYQVVMVINL